MGFIASAESFGGFSSIHNQVEVLEPTQNGCCGEDHWPHLRQGVRECLLQVEEMNGIVTKAETHASIWSAKDYLLLAKVHLQSSRPVDRVRRIREYSRSATNTIAHVRLTKHTTTVTSAPDPEWSKFGVAPAGEANAGELSMLEDMDCKIATKCKRQASHCSLNARVCRQYSGVQRRLRVPPTLARYCVTEDCVLWRKSRYALQYYDATLTNWTVLCHKDSIRRMLDHGSAHTYFAARESSRI